MIDFSDLPPLNALRGFEAVARHMSFSAAAQELRITLAAVSQKIKNLEDFLGVQLMPLVHRRRGNAKNVLQPYLFPPRLPGLNL